MVKMMTLVALMCILVVNMVVCEDACDYKPYFECMKPTKSPEELAKNRDLKNRAEKCMSSFGCNSPKSDRNVFVCREEVAHQSQNELEACMRENFKNFEFYEFRKANLTNLKQNENNDPYEHEDYDLHGKLAMLEQLCPNEAAKTDAKTCLESFAPKQATPKPDYEGQNQKICQQKKDCLQKLTPACQEKLKGSKDEACRCAKKILLPQKDQIEARYKNCESLASDPANFRDQENPKMDHLVQMWCSQHWRCDIPDPF